MKNKVKELDVDFIGGQKPLTKEEELAVSEIIKARKKNKQRIEPKPNNKTKQTVLQKD